MLQLYVVGPDDDVEAIKEEVMEDMTDIFASVDKTGGLFFCLLYTLPPQGRSGSIPWIGALPPWVISQCF